MEKIRGAAVHGLEELGPKVIPELTQVLEFAGGRTRRSALEVLGQLGAAARSAIPAILAWVERDSGNSRSTVDQCGEDWRFR